MTLSRLIPVVVAGFLAWSALAEAEECSVEGPGVGPLSCDLTCGPRSAAVFAQGLPIVSVALSCPGSGGFHSVGWFETQAQFNDTNGTEFDGYACTCTVSGSINPDGILGDGGVETLMLSGWCRC